MRRALFGVGLLVLTLAGPAGAETPGEAELRQASRAGVALWEGVSALYQFAADPHSPFKGEIVADYLNYVAEFEQNLKRLKVPSPRSDMRWVLEQRWAQFKLAGEMIIESGREGVCCTSSELARLREMADSVEDALNEVMEKLALAY
jgi:hypothetical protein